MASGQNDSFLVGTAISVYQNSGGEGTNWSDHEEVRNWIGQGFISNNDRCRNSNDFWNLYEEDIGRAKALNSTSFRLSIEWGRIEPQRGQLDQAAIKRYHEIFDCLHRNGLEPMVTLHHFVHPMWFEDAGGFTEKDNIKLFVNFAKIAFREFSSKVRLWVTFNEASVMTFCGFLYGVFPPGGVMQFQTAGLHLLHQLQAHSEVYRELKSMPGGSDAMVGIVHNHMDYVPKQSHWFPNLYIKPLCGALNHYWGTDILLNYFLTGEFLWKTPFGEVRAQEDQLPGLDFVGLNYYGRVVIDWNFQPSSFPGEVMTDMPFPLHAEGLFKGIKKMAELKVPIYITETGIADAQGDRREIMFNSYIDQVEKAVRCGFDVRGFLYWTLIDNFEWDHGFTIKFGLYEWSPDGTQRRTMRASSAALASIFAQLPGRIAAARQAWAKNGASALTPEYTGRIPAIGSSDRLVSDIV